MSNTKKLNILFTTSWYMTKITPFNGDFIYRHAKAVALYCKVSLLFVAFDPSLKNSSKIEINEQDGLKQYIIYFGTRYDALNIFTKWIKYFYFYNKGLRLILKNEGTQDIIHHNVIFPLGLIAWYFSKRLNIPYIVSEHWTGYLDNNSFKLNALHKAVAKLVAKRSKYIIPVSGYLKDSIEKLIPNAKFRVIPNVVDEKMFTADKIPQKKEVKQILHVSSLKDEHKNISGILRSFAEIKNIRSDFVFIIVNNEENKAIEKLVYDLKLSENIKILGKLTQKKIALLFKQIDFVVMFSWYETQGCVILESLMSGTPVISTKTGGIEHFVNDSNGLFVPKGNEDKLKNAILYLIDHHDKYNPNDIRRNIIDQVSFKSVGSQYVKIYNDCLGR